MQALTLYDQDAHSCGHQLTRSTNPAMGGQYEADADLICYACAADAEFRKAHKDLGAGAIVRVHDLWPKDEVLPPWHEPDADPDDVEDPAGD